MIADVLTITETGNELVALLWKRTQNVDSEHQQKNKTSYSSATRQTGRNTMERQIVHHHLLFELQSLGGDGKECALMVVCAETFYNI